MNPFDVKRALDTMQIIVDTREQDTDRSKRRYSDFKCKHVKGKLEYGDYCFNFQYPNGKWLHDLDVPEEKINPKIYIERKMNLDELALCFGTDRRRFKAEFERAREQGSRGYLIVENATWEHAINGRYRSKLNPTALVASLLAWSIRYKYQIIFCKAETSGKLIYSILYRELKEYLEDLEWGD